MVLPFLSQAGTTAANAADMPAVGADTQQANSLAELTRLLGGDLSASLTGGDKLLALSALMRSATRSGRRAGLTPQQVMGQLQQQKVAEMQNRLTIEQMRAKMAQEQRQIADTVEWSKTLPEAQRKAFLGQPLEKRLERMDAEAFRQRQLFQREPDPVSGKMRNVYQSGETELTDIAIPPNTDWLTEEVNGRQEEVLYDMYTNTPVYNKDGKLITRFKGIPEGQKRSIAVAEGNLAVRQAEFERGPPSGGRGKRNAPAVIYNTSGKQVLAEFDPVSRKYYVPNTNTIIERGVGKEKYD